MSLLRPGDRSFDFRFLGENAILVVLGFWIRGFRKLEKAKARNPEQTPSRLAPRKELTLDVHLDPVWNPGAASTARIRLGAIENLDKGKRFFHSVAPPRIESAFKLLPQSLT